MTRVGKLLALLMPVLAFAAIVAIAPIAARATITPSGDVDPTTDPSTWDSSTTVNVGYMTGAGTVTVDNTGSATTVTTGGLNIGAHYSYGGAGGTVTIPGGDGTVVVTGTGASWTNGRVMVGSSAVGNTGTLSVLNGGAMTVGYEADIGYYGGAGTLTVGGATFTSGGSLLIGTSGTGTMNVNSGGSVSAAYETYVGDSGVGSINFGAGGGSLSTRTLLAAPTSLTGTGTIAANGIVTDTAITFDSNASKLVSFTANQGVGVTLDMRTDANNGYLGAGYSGNGSVTISNGVAISTLGGYLGYNAGSSGIVTVRDGSAWTSTGAFNVGYRGAGTLNIQNGSTFGGAGSGIYVSSGTMTVTGSTASSSFATIGQGGGVGVATLDNATWTTDYLTVGISTGSSGTLRILNGSTMTVTATDSDASVGTGGGTGVLTVDGLGSTFTSSQTLWVGPNGTGTLNISNGGAVSVAGPTYAGSYISTGSVNFGAGGGTLTTKALCAPLTSLGSGNVVTKGLVTDNAALVFNSTASLNQSITVNGVNVSLDMSVPANNGGLGAGCAGTGTVSVSNGVSITSAGGALGYMAGSSGTATVDGATWLPGSTSDTFYVGNGGTGTLNVRNAGAFGTTASGCNLDIAYGPNSAGAVLVTGVNSKLVSKLIKVGDGGNGSLGFENSSVGTSTAAYIGYGRNAVGLVTVDHATWTVSSSFSVGYEGNGTLHIQNGGVLKTTGVTAYTDIGCWGTTGQGFGTGLVTVDGSGSKWTNTAKVALAVGGNNGGTLTITNGGSVTNANCPVTIGAGPAFPPNGVVSVVSVATGSTLTTGSAYSITVGYQGFGRLDIASGGYVGSGNSLLIGGTATGWTTYPETYNSCGTVTVDGANSRLTVGPVTSQNLYVGYNGAGTLKITNGGAVNNYDGFVTGYGVNGFGYAANMGGTVTISGAASTWTNQRFLYVGYMAPGTVNLDGGTIVADSVKGSAGTTTGRMILNFNGGTLKLYGGAALSPTWIQSVNNPAGDGLYVLEGGAKFDTAGNNTGIGMALQHSGTAATDGGVTKLGAGTLTLSGLNTYTGWTIVSGGALSLANDASLYDAGNVRVDTGTTLNLTFSGPDTVHYLFLGGLAQATGTYDVSNSGGFITGTGSLYVSATALQGDADLNGTVNSTDLGLLLSHYNQVGTGFAWGLGDFDANGTVNSTDLGLLLSHYNQTSAATSAVPEPSTLLLLAAGLIGLLAYAWRKQK